MRALIVLFSFILALFGVASFDPFFSIAVSIWIIIGAFKLAKKGYRSTNLKISFLMPLFLVFLSMAKWVGFFKAHIKGYGH